MAYRLVIDVGKTKLVKGGLEDARLLAIEAAESAGRSVTIEQAEAGNKWTEIEIVFANGSEISVKENNEEPNTLFGSFDKEPLNSPKSAGELAARGKKDKRNPMFFS